MDIKYFVRTTGERKLSPSFSQIEYDLLIDKEHKPNESFYNQLGFISQWDAVLLEDDVELCRDFKEKIEKIISEHPNDIINFFTKPSEFFTSHYQLNFVYNQCTYYPKGKITKEMIEEMRVCELQNLGYDVVEDKILHKHEIKVYLFRPCLVQHLDTKSIISSLKPKKKGVYVAHGNRWTPYYENYLLDLNIDYDNEGYEHRGELEKKLKEHKKTWRD